MGDSTARYREASVPVRVKLKPLAQVPPVTIRAGEQRLHRQSQTTVNFIDAGAFVKLAIPLRPEKTGEFALDPSILDVLGTEYLEFDHSTAIAATFAAIASV